MSPFSLAQANAVQIGNDAGWIVEFYSVNSTGNLADSPSLSLKSSDYYASIEAGLADDLQGGSFSFVFDSLTDADYQSISQGDSSGRPIAAKLYLFWNDAIGGAASYLKNLAGLSSGPSVSDLKQALVAVIFVTAPKRRVGPLSYQTEIHGVEWAFHMMRQPLQKPLEAETFSKVAAEIESRTNVSITTYPLGADRLTTDPPGSTGSEKVSYAKGKTYFDVLTDIAHSIEKNTNQYGRHMLLVRDGEIYLGPRKFPLIDSSKDLTLSTGLLEAFKEGSEDIDPTTPDLTGGSQRPHFTLTLKGRADLKPGDVVRFDSAPEDQAVSTSGIGSALLGAVSGPLLPITGDALTDKALSLCVTSVKHRQGKEWGFYSEVKGVVLADISDPWDSYSDTGSAPKPKTSSPSADSGGNAANAIKDFVAVWGANRISFDVGQVRSFTSQTSGPPSQTEIIWEGLQELDNNPNGIRRLPVDQKNAVRLDIPYASPFAWGKCGLVLPRYPGTRVVLGHRRGFEQDPVDLGSVWDSGTGPDSLPGDWWLSLPVGIDSSKRDKAADDEDPTPWDGAVTHDLIDADGNRIVELGSLIIRAYSPNELHDAGTRPNLPDDAGSISIEHVSGGSKILMRQDGSILIQGSSITLDAGSGDITINAKNVNVNVEQAMNVQ